MSGLKSFIIRWNNDHPLDKGFRDKYKIAFNSPKHRSINQFDILCEYIENALIKEFEEKVEKELKQKEQFGKGIWLNDNITEEVSEDLFDKLDISSLNSSDSQLQVE